MEIKRYLLPLWKWWWLVLACTFVATSSAYLATRQQPPIYSTRATVMVGSAIANPNPNGNELYLSQQLASTYADIMKRETVRTQTQEALGLTWLPEYTARVVGNTQLIEITVTDTNPQRAQAVANELVHQLVLLSPSSPDREDAQRQVFIANQLADLEAKIEETEDEIAQKQADLGNLFSARQIADTQTQIEGLQDKLGTLRANYAALLANTQAGALNTITLIEEPALPTEPVGPQKLAMILLAAAIGFALAACAAYLLEHLDDTIKNPDDVQNELALSTLGAVPRADNALLGDGPGLLALKDNRSHVAEAYRVLRTNLQFASVKHPVRALLITSSVPHEGKSITAANLAVALAQAGKRVILVDTDLHRPRLHKLFELVNTTGVTTALLDEELTPETALQETKLPGLRVLPSGPLPPNPAELLGSEKMQELMNKLKAQADLVVFDSPPVTALADTAILSTRCDGVLMVLSAGKTRRDEAKRALEALRQVGARVLGAILNQMPMRRQGYYYYYHYAHAYEVEPEKGKRGSSRPKRRSRFRSPAGADVSRPVELRSAHVSEGSSPGTGQENGTSRKVKLDVP